MMQHCWRLAWVTLFGIICLLPYPVYAVAPPPQLIIGPIQVLEDPATTATLDDILARRTAFTDLTTSSPNYGFTTSAYWLRILVQNGQPVPTSFYLDVKNPLLDAVTLHLIGVDGSRTTVESGLRLPANERPYLATTLVLPFTLAANEAATLYVRVHSHGMPLFVPFELLTEAVLQHTVTMDAILKSAILSVFGAMLIYNLFIFSVLRNRLYLYYILYLFVGSLGIAHIGGFGPAYLYPASTWPASQGLLILTGISLAMMIVFAREFLAIVRYPRLDRLAQGLIIWALLQSIGSLVWPVPISYMISTAMALIYSGYCLSVGIAVWWRGKTEVRFFLIGQISSWCGVIIISLHNAGLLPYHSLIYQSPALGGVADALLLSLALGDRIRILQRNQLAAEEQARRNLEIRSDELERLVAERTSEIKTLHGILPICANCKKIRTEEGAWQQLESYISQHTDAQFSHGICTDCMQELYPKIQRKRQQKGAM